MPRSVRAAAITAVALAVLSSGVVAASAQTGEPAPTSAPPRVDIAETPDPSDTSDPADIPTTPDAPVPAGGPDPADAAADENLAELARLSGEAGALGEELHLAREELDRAEAERDRRERAAGIAAGRAVLADLDASRDQSLVDRLATMRYRGGDTGATRAAVLAESPGDLVNRLGTLQRLSGTTTSALDASRAASAEAARLRAEAESATELARAAARDAQRRADALDVRTEQMQERIDEVVRRVDALSDAQRALWAGGPLIPPGYVAPPVDGANSAALNVALTRLGAPYSWGATGPSSFDCSGLMVWSYAQEGKTLPRSSQAQAVAGSPVAMADIQPGDLVIYYPGATHVGMYAGDGLVLHAPDYGVPVKLEKVTAMPISGIRRY